MASDSGYRGEIRSLGDSDYAIDGFLASARHDQGDASVSGESRGAEAANEVQQVPVNQGVPIIRVQVAPGETLELASPFDPGAVLLAREDNGNLAIKVGDVTVILEGFVSANAQAPVVVETSDGKPIDIALLLASTDPDLDIQTAAGPAQGDQAQGADNTGAILAALEGGAGLGGFDAVGKQDGTALGYGLIDNAIRLELSETTTTTFAGPLRSIDEPFLRDPAVIFNSHRWQSYGDFEADYLAHLNFADYDGTAAGDATSVEDFLAKTTQTIIVPHSSASAEYLDIAGFIGTPPTSDGSPLAAQFLDHATVVFTRGDGTVVLLAHVLNQDTTGNFEVQLFLINRLDHPGTPVPGSDSDHDVLTLDFSTTTFPTGQDAEGIPGHFQALVLDDAPVALDVRYDHGESLDGAANDKGLVDEDWLGGGSHDADNTPPGADSDPAQGDEAGGAFVTGNLKIAFGADGPAGADGDEATFTLGVDRALVLGLDVEGNPLFLNDQGHVLDANGKELTSGNNPLVVLEHSVDGKGIEHLVVGYLVADDAAQAADAGLFFPQAAVAPAEVKVFELTLDVNPDDRSGPLQFQDFKFELFKGIDQSNDGASTPETNIPLRFQVIGHDDDGDAVHTAINIQVNDDAPVAVDDHDSNKLHSGNVITNPDGADLLGGDGATVTLIRHDGDVANVDQNGGDTKLDGDWGTLTVHDDGSWSYDQTKFTADPSQSDVFQYTLTDGDGDTSTAALTIGVRATVAADDNIYTNIHGSIFSGPTNLISFPNTWLLANDTAADPANNLLAITDVMAAAGQGGRFQVGPALSILGGNTFFALDVGPTITPNDPDQISEVLGGSAQFVYTIEDPHHLSSTATATVNYVSSAALLANGFVLAGSDGDDIVISAGVVALQGGAGNDVLYGNEVFFGPPDSAKAIIDFGETTGPWSFTLAADGAGTADINGHDTYFGIAGVAGGSGANEITGNQYANTLRGGDGDDTLNGGKGTDALFGEGGNDVMIFDQRDFVGSPDPADTLDGGSGFDTVKFITDFNLSPTFMLNFFHNVEMLDLGKGGDADNVKVSVGDNLTPAVVDQITAGGGALYITGDSGDTVSIQFGIANNTFDFKGTVTNSDSTDPIPNGTYFHYQGSNGFQQADLYVETTVG